MEFLLHSSSYQNHPPPRYPRSNPQDGNQLGLLSSAPYLVALWKQLKDLFRHDMKRIIAETERGAFAQTPPNNGSPIAKWTPRTPPRPERMPPTAGSPSSLSPDKRVDVKTSPGISQGSSSIVRLDSASSGLSITRPRGAIPVVGVGKSQSQSPPKAITPKLRIHDPLPVTRAQSTQLSQPITPTKMGVGSPSIRRTSWVSSPSATHL